MCGRVVRTHTAAEIAEELDATNLITDPLVADYNIAPTRELPIVLRRANEGRQLELGRWGLVPAWAKDPSVGNRMINARAETLTEKPAYRAAFEKRRCVVAVSGFYEWQTVEGRKQPWFVRRADHGILNLAGLYEEWRDAEGRILQTCAIITTTAADDVGHIHHRAPLVVGAEDVADWIDPTIGPSDELVQLLVPALSGTFMAHPVDVAVGDVRNNSPDLVRPVAVEPSTVQEALF